MSDDRSNIQKWINSSPDGSINHDNYDPFVEEMKKDNWEQIEDGDFSVLRAGERIRYTIIDPKKKHVFRTGGILMMVDPSNKWLVYKGHTKRNWSLQKENIVDLYRLPMKEVDQDQPPKKRQTRKKVLKNNT